MNSNNELINLAYYGKYDDLVNIFCNNESMNESNVTAVDKDGATALHFASTMGHGNIISLLLSQNAKLDAVDKKKRTAYDYSTLMKKQEVFKEACKEENIQAELQHILNTKRKIMMNEVIMPSLLSIEARCAKIEAEINTTMTSSCKNDENEKYENSNCELHVDDSESVFMNVDLVGEIFKFLI